MKEGFTFNYISLIFLKEVVLRNFGSGGKTEKSQQPSRAKFNSAFRL